MELPIDFCSSTEVYVNSAAFGGLKISNLAPKESVGELTASTYRESITVEENYDDERSNISDSTYLCMEDDWNDTLQHNSQDKPKVTQ